MSEKVVYEIVNEINDKKYIGSTNSRKKRWARHRSMLRDDCHTNQHLQNSYNKYGKDNFQFSIIEEVKDEKDLLDRENFYLKYWNYHAADMLYNMALDASAPMQGRTGEDAPMYGREHKETTKRKISEAHKGKEVSKETRRRISAATTGENNPMYGTHRAGEDNPMYGKEHDKMTKQKISEAMSGENNPNYGKECKETTKRKISEANSGEDAPMYDVHRTGEDSPNNKLTENQVKGIKHLLKDGNLTHKEIGKKFEVVAATISMISIGENWSHVEI